MAVVKCKPTSPGRRHVVKVVNPELHKGNFIALYQLRKKTAKPMCSLRKKATIAAFLASYLTL